MSNILICGRSSGHGLCNMFYDLMMYHEHLSDRLLPRYQTHMFGLYVCVCAGVCVHIYIWSLKIKLMHPFCPTAITKTTLKPSVYVSFYTNFKNFRMYLKMFRVFSLIVTIFNVY